MTRLLLLSLICCTASLASAGVIGRDSDEPVHNFVFASNGVLALMTEGTIELYTSQSLEHIGTIDAAGPKESVGVSVQFQPHGPLLMAIERDRIVLYRLPDLHQVGVLEPDGKQIDAVAFSSDGKLIASKHKNRIDLWSIETLARTNSWTITPAELLPVLADSIRTFDGKVVDPRIQPLQRRAGSTAWKTVRGQTIEFSPDGRFLAALQWQSIHLWNLTTGEEEKTISETSPFAMLQYTADGRYLLATASEFTSIWDTFEDEELGYWQGQHMVFEPRRLSTWQVRDFSVSNDGMIALARWHLILLWDLKTKQNHGLVAHPGALGDRPDFQTVDISDDRRLLAAGSQDGAVCLWDAGTLEYLGVLGEHESAVEHLEFAPDGQMMVSRSADGVVMGWAVSEDSLVLRRDRAAPPSLQTDGVWIPFNLKSEASVDFRISNFWGQTVRTISLEYQVAEAMLGRPRRIYWDLKDSSGVLVPGVDYHVSVKNGSHSKNHTILHEHGTFRLP